MKSTKNTVLAILLICLLGAGLFACAGKKKPEPEPTPVLTATEAPTPVVTEAPRPTEEPTPEPTEEPTPTPEPIRTARDSFEASGFSGGYVSNFECLDWTNTEILMVGGRLIVLCKSYGITVQLLSIDPDTREVISLDLSEEYNFGYLVKVSDDLFALCKVIETRDYDGYGYDYDDYEYKVSNTAYQIYDSNLCMIRGFQGNSSYETPFFGSDQENLWYYDYSVLKLMKCNYITGEKTAVENDVFSRGADISSVQNGDYIFCSHWNDSDMLDDLVIYDTVEEKILLNNTGDQFYFIENHDRTKCAVICRGKRKAITIYDCSGKDLLDSEGMYAHEPVSSINISNSGEIEKVLIDWERGYVITRIFSSRQFKGFYSLCCYSMETGKLVADYDIADPDNYEVFDFVMDEEDGLVYCVCKSENSSELTVFAWDYANDDAADTRGIYQKSCVVPDFIEKKRAEFEAKHGFVLYLGSEVFASDYDYRLVLCTDWDTVSETIDVLDEVLANYPEDFFEQIRTGSIKTLAIYLCNGFIKVSDYSADNAIALATYFGYEQALALDVNYRYCLERTIVHEISHWIDSKISRAGELGICTDYEDEWLTYQPSDFSYKYSYTSGKTIWKYISGYGDEVYFTDDYCQTYPGEDRARSFEYLMYPDTTTYMESPYIRAKLRYYFSVIRQVFDDTDWPEETSWEEKLRLAEEGQIETEEENRAEVGSDGEG